MKAKVIGYVCIIHTYVCTKACTYVHTVYTYVILWSKYTYVCTYVSTFTMIVDEYYEIVLRYKNAIQIIHIRKNFGKGEYCLNTRSLNPPT